MQDGIVHVVAKAPAASNEHDVEVRATLQRVVRYDLHAPGGGDRGRCLGHQEREEGRGLLPPLFLVQSGDREDFEGTTEVEHLDVFVDDDSNALAFHTNLLTARLGRPGHIGGILSNFGTAGSR